ncbi:MAG: HDOD domain-containing protein [Rubrivivax sp.]|nr:HDOD domain-containing protein [Rubrivivax sp.]
MREGERQGRFELKRELGRGAQATVWLAHDPLLQRDVALKLLDTTDHDAGELDHWLHEARAVSALSHPNVVPVFEAVDAAAGNGRPYLVFEYVEGPTLAQARRMRGAWPAREAVTLMLGVLDALAAAHAAGLVHRDLKPSNVLLGTDGRARVMDFGIAARVPEPGSRRGRSPSGPGDEGTIVGSPGYISPEAARGEAPAPAMDVFAAGVMLGELLGGEPLLKERDPWRALERVQREDLQLPSSLRLDEALRGIVMRALARDASSRYDGASAMHAALAAWLAPEAPPPPAGEAGHATLEFLLRRMRHKTDFPALSDSVLRIQSLAASETARLTSLADEVLTDVALTNKLLRMVNSVHFASAGSGQITTVSRAVALVGFAGIRNMAMAVLLLEHMKDKGQAELLRQEFLRALTAGALAAELEPRSRDSEEAFLGSMLQNLGTLLAEFYFPEEAERIRQLVAAPGAPTAGVRPALAANPVQQTAGMAREAAAALVLGLTLDELGAGVAKAWGLPEGLQNAMRRPRGDVPSRAIADRTDRLRWVGHAANALADTLMEQGSDALNDALEHVAGRYSQALGIAPPAARQATHLAREKVAALAQAMGIAVPKRGPARRLLVADPVPAAPAQVAPQTVAGRAPGRSVGGATPAPGRAEPPSSGRAAPGDERTMIAEASGTSASAPNTPSASAAATEACLAALSDGRHRIERGLADGKMRLNEVLQLGLATLQQGLSCRSVVFCLRDARGTRQGQMQRLRGRMALGPLPAEVFDVQPANSGDLLAVVSARAVDTLIADAGTVAARMPAWWRERVNAGTFLLLPLAMKGATLGLIYADKSEAGSLAPSVEQLAAARSLRDAMTGAFVSGLR